MFITRCCSWSTASITSFYSARSSTDHAQCQWGQHAYVVLVVHYIDNIFALYYFPSSFCTAGGSGSSNALSHTDAGLHSGEISDRELDGAGAVERGEPKYLSYITLHGLMRDFINICSSVLNDARVRLERSVRLSESDHLSAHAESSAESMPRPLIPSLEVRGMFVCSVFAFLMKLFRLFFG